MDYTLIFKKWPHTALMVSLLTLVVTSQMFDDVRKIEEHPSHVIFRSKVCQSAPESTLLQQLGSQFDGARMATTQRKANMLTHRKRRSMAASSDDETNTGGDHWFLKKLRHKRSSDQQTTPWECKLTHITRHNRAGVFPQFISDGQCVSKKCFYNMYNCEPVTYSVQVLRRNPHSCNVVPLAYNETIYEETWNLAMQKVTVACNCVKPIFVRFQTLDYSIKNRR